MLALISGSTEFGVKAQLRGKAPRQDYDYNVTVDGFPGLYTRSHLFAVTPPPHRNARFET